MGYHIFFNNQRRKCMIQTRIKNKSKYFKILQKQKLIFVQKNTGQHATPQMTQWEKPPILIKLNKVINNF